MWTLKQREDDTVCLFYDRSRRFSNSSRGIWEVVGPQGNQYTEYAVRVNEGAGYICADDSEGNVRVLVLEE